MVSHHRNNVRRSGLTNPYQDLRSLSGSHWCFWFGHHTVYHCLPLSGSGSGPTVSHLYQTLPPRTRD